MKLCLLSCCAPCSLDTIYELKNRGTDFVVLFYNPNIYPESEYILRRDAQIKLCDELGVKYHIGDYDTNAFALETKGMEDEPERGARCTACFRHRIKYAAKWAHENGFDTLATTLGVSRHKCQAQVDKVWNVECGVWNDKLNYIHITPHSTFHIPHLYKQSYCGCKFSMRKK